MKGSKNSAAARLLIRFVVGEDSPNGEPGFAPLYVAGDYPTHTDMQHPKDAIALTAGTWRWGNTPALPLAFLLMLVLAVWSRHRSSTSSLRSRGRRLVRVAAGIRVHLLAFL